MRFTHVDGQDLLDHKVQGLSPPFFFATGTETDPSILDLICYIRNSPNALNKPVTGLITIPIFF